MEIFLLVLNVMNYLALRLGRGGGGVGGGRLLPEKFVGVCGPLLKTITLI